MCEEKSFHRRWIRLCGVDYSEQGAYFVTICAAKRRNIFGKIEEGRAVLSTIGDIVRTCWVQIPEHFPATTLKEFVVMPNHLHGIIALTVRARLHRALRSEGTDTRAVSETTERIDSDDCSDVQGGRCATSKERT